MSVIFIILSIDNLGKSRCICLEFLFVLLHTLLGLVLAIKVAHLFIVIIEVAYSLIRILVASLFVSLGNCSIHCIELRLILGHILFCKCQDVLVTLLYHIHIRIELCAVDTSYFETYLIRYLEILSWNRILKSYCCKLKVIVALVDTLLHNLYHVQVIVLCNLSLAQSVASIGEYVSICFTVVHLYACHKLVVGIQPIVGTLVHLHKRGLCNLVKSLCKGSEVRQIVCHLLIYIVAELIGTEIYITLIFKFAMYFLSCDCILVDRINLLTIYNLLTGTA